jgi:tRNA(fMet)-specific endonuclease VapC
MTGNKILLDTNIVSALFKGDLSVINGIDAASEIYIPVIVIGELYYGAEYSTQAIKNKTNIVELTQLYEILPVNTETAKIYGALKTTLRNQGTPIPENDIWIAALSKQHDLDLISRDKHFTNLTDISLINW